MFCCSEAVVAQVLDELGLQMADQLSGNFMPSDVLVSFDLQGWVVHRKFELRVKKLK